MWKKGLSVAVLSGVLLVGCNGNGNTVSEHNETPRENVRDGAQQWKNEVERDTEGQNQNNGTMNENREQTDVNENNTHKNNNGVRDNGENPQVEIIEDLNRKNGVH